MLNLKRAIYRREIELVLHKHFPESKPQEEYLKILLDEELKALMQDSQKELSEKDQALVLKKVLKRFFLTKKPRQTSPRKHTRYIPRSPLGERRQQLGCRPTFPSAA